jgi:hypothetical protein
MFKGRLNSQATRLKELDVQPDRTSYRAEAPKTWLKANSKVLISRDLLEPFGRAVRQDVLSGWASNSSII